MDGVIIINSVPRSYTSYNKDLMVCDIHMTYTAGSSIIK